MSEKMRDSGVDWIGEIPVGWEVKKLLYDLRDPITDGPHETPELVGKGIPFISVDSLDDEGNIDLNVKKFISKELYEEYNRKTKLTKGDVFFTKAATIGKTAIYDAQKLMVWSPIAVVKPGENLLSKYLYYIFKTDGYVESAKLLGGYTTQINLGMRAMESTKIPSPPLTEQKNITDYLDKQTSKFDQAQKLLKNEIERLRAYKKSLIYETVIKGLDKNVQFKDSGMDWIGEIPEDWEVSPLKFLTTKIGSGKTPLGGAETYLDEGIMLLRSQNIYSEALRLDDVVRISEEVFREMQSTSVNKNDVLLNITGASIGRVGFYDLDEKANVNQHVSIIRTKIDFLSPKYLFYVLQSSVGQNYISTYQFGGNREGLNFQQIGNFRLPVPELTIQEEISKYLDEKTNKIDQIIKIKEQQLTNLSEQRKTLIYEVVTGKRKINV